MEESSCFTEHTYSQPFALVDAQRTHWIRLFVQFMLKNQPCMLRSSVTDGWPSRQKWVKRSENGEEINLDYILENYGTMEVPLMDEPYEDYRTIRLSDYIEYLRRHHIASDAKYVKDWHFQKESGTSYGAYNLPSFLRFDWINNEEWSGGNEDPLGDYRFVYFGTKNSWTVFHSDVMSSYSWSANICGRKLWYFVPPGNEELFRKDRNGFIKDIRTARERWTEAGVVQFVQLPGQIVFVPSNWYHQVHNLEDAISINHNFINASNVDVVLRLVFDRLIDVRNEIADVKDIFTKTEFDEECQKILKADIRINFDLLHRLLQLVIKDRSSQTDQCWICAKHGVNLFECKKDDECLKQIVRSVEENCSCTQEALCINCSRFMKEFELSCALQCAHLIDVTN
ncbi:unnamed protein product [Toxocara canis]|uniref:Jumonji domain-containing protein 4 n=1 Tax=Toxocara canis TaxID=6265 RepID=A0A183V3N6_TOXCA|nr:unnamed protein product [Toxocara canis]